MKISDFLFGRGGVKKQTVIVVFSDAIKFASGLISTMILARVISVNSMGTYRQLMYLGLLAVAVTELGLSTSVYRFWNFLGKRKQSSYAKMLVVFSFCLGGAGTVLLAASASLFSTLYHNPDLRTALLISAPLPLATLPLMLVRPILISRGDTLQGTLLETLFSLTSIFSLVIPLWLGESLPVSLAWWIGVSLLRLIALPVVLKTYLRQPGT
jgi:O-antigen/teichoic acid export membrane protein